MSNNLRVDLSQAPWVECECGNKLFETSTLFKRVSSLLSPTGKEEVVQIEVAICKECKKIPAFSQRGIKDIPENLKAVKTII